MMRCHILLLLTLAIAGVASADLTGRLVEDPESMANIVGVKETQSLVDYKLKQVQARREDVAARAKEAKEASAQRYQEMQDIERSAAELHAQERHLKEKVVIDKDTADEKEAVAEKADAIAKKMEALAQAADSEMAKAKAQEAQSSQQLQEISSRVKETDSEKRKAEARRRLAEKAASAASADLADVDSKEKGLLQRHAKLERMAAEEDNRQTTRLAEAFNEDARRQAQFRQSLVHQRQAELAQKQHQQLTHDEHKRQMQEKAAAFKQVVGAQQQQQVQSLTALERALLRKNPELAKYRTMGQEEQNVGSGLESLSQGLGSIRRDYRESMSHGDTNSAIKAEFDRLRNGGGYVRDARSPRQLGARQSSLRAQFKQFTRDQGLGSVMLAQRDKSPMWRSSMLDSTWAQDHPGSGTVSSPLQNFGSWGQKNWDSWRQNAMSNGGFNLPTPGEPQPTGQNQGQATSWENSNEARRTERHREQRQAEFLEDADFNVPASNVPRI